MESNEKSSSPLRYLLMAVAAVIGIILLCYLAFTLMARYAPTTSIADMSATVRDLLLIILAIESMVVGVFLLLMLWQLFVLITVLRDEVIPLLNTTKETVEQVKHTTTFVGQSVSAPIISAAGFISATRMVLNTLRGPQHPQKLTVKESALPKTPVIEEEQKHV